MAEYLVSDTDLASVADAIRAKGGTSAQLEFPSGFNTAIGNIQTSGDVTIESLSVTTNGTYTAPSGKAYTPVVVNVQGSEPRSQPLNDVIYIDYDGTVLYSYSATEFLQLTEHPANPSHTGLTAQGWNWTLSDAKTYVQANGDCIIGQLYTTTDGWAKIYFAIPGDEYKDVLLPLTISNANDVQIDWNDGSSVETMPQSGNRFATHTYTATGEHCISIKPTAGTVLIGNSSTGGIILTGCILFTLVSKIELASNVGLYGIDYAGALKTITFSDNTPGNIGLQQTGIKGAVIPFGASIKTRTFASDFCRFVSLPKTFTIVGGNSFFTNCVALQKATYPGNKLLANTFQYCYGLTKFTVNANVTEIGNSAFGTCGCLSELHMKPTSPPTLGTNVFQNIPSGWKIYVPYSADHSVKSAYISDASWSIYTSIIEEEPQ